jgi:excisionase family DNA binding protein
MENPQDRTVSVGQPAPLAVAGSVQKTVAAEKSSYAIFKRTSAPPLRPSRKTPATPLMLTPTAAWRTLCARTGGGIALGSFYRWIRDGRIFSIRMGRKILVPVETMDEVIEKCLSGEEWF